MVKAQDTPAVGRLKNADAACRPAAAGSTACLRREALSLKGLEQLATGF